MFDREELAADLGKLGLGAWLPALAPLIDKRLSAKGHGDFGRWHDAYLAAATAGSADELRAALLRLKPWRKGPFRLGDVTIDAEWRSDMKWDRVAPHLLPLAGRTVLDVGCGNGWYAARMREAGAKCVIGVDPTVLFNLQFAAVRNRLGLDHVHVLPLRLEELPPKPRAFDTTFSMGVLYHSRYPALHLAALRDTLTPGGELVLETLVLPGDGDDVVVPGDRYAKMRNVWHLPTVSALCGWLDDAGLVSVRVADVTVTTTAEQRSTEWMDFDSLAEALDPADPSRTVEGLPAPTRVTVIAVAP